MVQELGVQSVQMETNKTPRARPEPHKKSRVDDLPFICVMSRAGLETNYDSLQEIDPYEQLYATYSNSNSENEWYILSFLHGGDSLPPTEKTRTARKLTTSIINAGERVWGNVVYLSLRHPGEQGPLFSHTLAPLILYPQCPEGLELR